MQNSSHIHNPIHVLILGYLLTSEYFELRVPRDFFQIIGKSLSMNSAKEYNYDKRHNQEVLAPSIAKTENTFDEIY